MLNIIINILIALIMAWHVFYSSTKLDTTINFKNYKKIIFILLFSTILLGVNHNYNSNEILKPLLSFLAIVVINKYAFDKSLSKAITISFVTYLLITIAEIILMLLWTLTSNENTDFLSSNLNYQLLGSIAAAGIFYIILNIEAVQTALRNIIKWAEAKKTIIYSIVILLIATSMGALVLNSSRLAHINLLYMTNITIISTFGIIALYLIKERGEKERLNKEYDGLLKYVKTYEEWMEKQRIAHHEDTNQLITIKGMVRSENKRLNKYIDGILNTPQGKEYSWLNKLKNIPSGGLKGLIYYKITEMQREKLNVSVDISEEIKKSEIEKISTKIYKDICRAVGIVIDNAKEASAESEEKLVGIEVYLKKKEVHISISNSYKGNIDLAKFYRKGYSTKGVGRGHGLSLMKDIINKNKNIFQQREMVNNCYVQHVIIKI